MAKSVSNLKVIFHVNWTFFTGCVLLFHFTFHFSADRWWRNGRESYTGKLCFKLLSKFSVVIFIYRFRLRCFYIVCFYSRISNKRGYQMSALTVGLGLRIFHSLWILKSLCYWDSFKLSCTAWKVSKYGVFSGPYFPVFELIQRFTE